MGVWRPVMGDFQLSFATLLWLITRRSCQVREVRESFTEPRKHPKVSLQCDGEMLESKIIGETCVSSHTPGTRNHRKGINFDPETLSKSEIDFIGVFSRRKNDSSITIEIFLCISFMDKITLLLIYSTCFILCY